MKWSNICTIDTKHIQFIRAALIMLGGKLVTSMKVLCFRVPCRGELFLYTSYYTSKDDDDYFSLAKYTKTTTTKTNNHIKCGNSPQMTDTVHFMILSRAEQSRAYRRGSLYHSQLNYYTSIIYSCPYHIAVVCMPYRCTHFFRFFLSLMDYLSQAKQVQS